MRVLKVYMAFLYFEKVHEQNSFLVTLYNLFIDETANTLGELNPAIEGKDE